VVIAIDGPAGAGKSTVARALAQALGFGYLDSGAMYRAVGLAVRDAGAGDPGQIARDADIDLSDGKVLLNGADVTTEIRTPRVSEAASKVATLKPVRAALVDKQRALLHDGRDWVAEGRDIGTVVAPDAELKVFLVASAETRARRRAEELGTDYETVYKDQLLRDQQDAQREHSPMKPADDSVTVDTSELTIDEVVAHIADLAREKAH
jgi:cytidylate kinase